MDNARISEGAIWYGFRTNNSDYALIDAFTTVDGSWEPDGGRWSIPQWARDEYLRPLSAPDYFDDAGGGHHVFIRIEDKSGKPLVNAYQMLLDDGRLSVFQTKEKSGWANQPLWNTTRGDGTASNIHWFNRGDSVALFVGGGLPANMHVSLFLVFRDKRDDGIAEPEEPDAPEGRTLFASVEGDTVHISSGGKPFRIEVN